MDCFNDLILIIDKASVCCSNLKIVISFDFLEIILNRITSESGLK